MSDTEPICVFRDSRQFKNVKENIGARKIWSSTTRSAVVRFRPGGHLKKLFTYTPKMGKTSVVRVAPAGVVVTKPDTPEFIRVSITDLRPYKQKIIGHRVVFSDYVTVDASKNSDFLFGEKLESPWFEKMARRYEPLIDIIRVKREHRMREALQEESSEGLGYLLGSLNEITDVRVLRRWLVVVAKKGLSLESGVLPDNYALEIFVRVLALNCEAALESFNKLINPKNSPKLMDDFPISLLGALTAHASFSSAAHVSIIPKWATKQIHLIFASRLVIAKQHKLSFVAGLVGLYFMSLPDGIAEGKATENLLQYCLGRFKQKGEKGLFLQYVADSVADLLTEDDNFAKHIKKLLFLSQYIHGKSVTWPDDDFIEILEHMRKLKSPLFGRKNGKDVPIA